MFQHQSIQPLILQLSLLRLIQLQQKHQQLQQRHQQLQQKLTLKKPHRPKPNQLQLQRTLHHQNKKVQQRKKHQQMINRDPRLKKAIKKLLRKHQSIQTSKKHQHAQREQSATNMTEKLSITKSHSTASALTKTKSAIRIPLLFHTSQPQYTQPPARQPILPKLHQRLVNIFHQRLHQ
jgi:hypothetical protein